MLMLIVTATATMSAQDELEQTLDPVIIIEEPIDGEVNILVVCDEPATIYVSIDGGEVGCGENVFNIIWQQNEVDQEIMVSAYAIAEGKAPSNTVYFPCFIPALPQPTSAPEIVFLDEGYQMIVYIENTDDYDATIYYRCFFEYEGYPDDDFFMEYSGPFVFDKYGYFGNVVTIEAYAIAEGKLASEHVMAQ